MSSNQKFYFISYTKLINGVAFFCNDTTKEHPVKWIMEKCKGSKRSENLVFYKEITEEEYIVFHPEHKISSFETRVNKFLNKETVDISEPKELTPQNKDEEICDNCNGNAHPMGEYCQGCDMTEYRRSKE